MDIRYIQRKSISGPAIFAEWGDSYIWMAIDSETKLVLSYLTAKRDSISAYDFIRDLSGRVTGRFQITTDGLRGYVPAIEEYFGADMDFAQLVKFTEPTTAKGQTGTSPLRSRQRYPFRLAVTRIPAISLPVTSSEQT